MKLEGLTLNVGHDNSNKKYSSGYYNGCVVRYFKYFP